MSVHLVSPVLLFNNSTSIEAVERFLKFCQKRSKIESQILLKNSILGWISHFPFDYKMKCFRSNRKMK